MVGALDHRWSLAPGRLSFSVRFADATVYDEIAIGYDGPERAFNIDPRAVLGALKETGVERATFSVSESSALSVRGSDGEHWLYAQAPEAAD